jgi:hypothetical protein
MLALRNDCEFTELDMELHNAAIWDFFRQVLTAKHIYFHLMKTCVPEIQNLHIEARESLHGCYEAYMQLNNAAAI